MKPGGGGETEISGGGTPDTGCGTPYRLNLTSVSTRTVRSFTS